MLWKNIWNAFFLLCCDVWVSHSFLFRELCSVCIILDEFSSLLFFLVSDVHNKFLNAAIVSSVERNIVHCTPPSLQYAGYAPHKLPLLQTKIYTFDFFPRKSFNYNHFIAMESSTAGRRMGVIIIIISSIFEAQRKAQRDAHTIFPSQGISSRDLFIIIFIIINCCMTTAHGFCAKNAPKLGHSMEPKGTSIFSAFIVVSFTLLVSLMFNVSLGLSICECTLVDW